MDFLDLPPHNEDLRKNGNDCERSLALLGQICNNIDDTRTLEVH